MYLSASIPIVGPMVLVTLTPQYFHSGARPLELLPPDHSLITWKERGKSGNLVCNRHPHRDGIDHHEPTTLPEWNTNAIRQPRDASGKEEGAHLWRTRRSRGRSARSWGTRGARTAAPPARTASWIWTTGEQTHQIDPSFSNCASEFGQH